MKMSGNNQSDMVLGMALQMLGGRALEELIHGDQQFSIESALALEQVSNLLLKNSVLLNLNKGLNAPEHSTQYHPDYFSATDEVKRNIEANADALIGQLYQLNKEMMKLKLKEVKKLRKILLKKEVLTGTQISELLKLNVK